MRALADPTRRHPAAGAALLLPLLVAVACAAPAEFHTRSARPVAWPAPDRTPRIDFEFAYGGSADVELHPGFFGWLFGLLAGQEEVHLVSPAGLAVVDDVLWIADPGAGCVHRLSLTSGDHRICRGSDAQPFRSPIGVAAVGSGELWVTDAATAALTVLDTDGAALRTCGGAAVTARPTGICFDRARNRVLVVDTVGCKLVAFDTAGNVLGTKGGRGVAPGEFNFPTNLAIASDGRVAVVDSLNFRVQILSPELDPLHMFGRVGRGPGEFANPKGLAIDAFDHVYVVDSMFDNVQIFDLDGQLLLPFAGTGHDLGQLYLPTGIHIDATNRIFVADAGNARVQVLRLHTAETTGERP